MAIYQLLSPPRVNCPRSERFWCPVGVIMCLGDRVQIRIETLTEIDSSNDQCETDLLYFYSWSPAEILQIRPIGNNFYLDYPGIWLSPRAMGLSESGRITGFMLDLYHIQGQSYALY